MTLKVRIQNEFLISGLFSGTWIYIIVIIAIVGPRWNGIIGPGWNEIIDKSGAGDFGVAAFLTIISNLMAVVLMYILDVKVFSRDLGVLPDGQSLPPSGKGFPGIQICGCRNKKTI